MKNRLRLCAGIMIAMLPTCMLAQDDQPKQAEPAKATATAHAELHFYHLEFVIKEVGDEKVLNSRSFSTSIATEIGHNMIRAGGRVPILTGTGPIAQYQYMDLGVNVDVHRAQEMAGRLTLGLSAEVSLAEKPENAANAPPLVRQFKWEADVVVLPGKPTVIFSSDDVTSKRKMQVELTATRIQ